MVIQVVPTGSLKKILFINDGNTSSANWFIKKNLFINDGNTSSAN